MILKRFIIGSNVKMYRLYKGLDNFKHIVKKNKILKSIFKTGYNIVNRIKNIIINPKHKYNEKIFEFEIINQSKNKVFFFIQIGANDGKMADPIFQNVIKFNWHGILVEPQKKEFKNLKYNYKNNKNLKFENVGIDEITGKRCLYHINPNKIRHKWEKGIASFIKSNLSNYPEKDIMKTYVKTISFDELIKKHNVTKIDLLLIDTEGFDYKILKTINFKFNKPKIIRFEKINLDSTEKYLAKQLLKKNGYNLFSTRMDYIGLLK